jgi:zinc protease
LISLPALHEALPTPHAFHLQNGVQVVSVRQEQAPVVCLDFWCRAGSATERQAESGLAHFLEHMVFKGSENLAAGAFDQRIEALGGSSNAATGFDDVHYHVLIPPAAAAEALDLLLDLVLHPRLEASDFDMERQVVLEELAQSEDQPEDVAFQRLLALSCPDHAYGRAILGERKALIRHNPVGMAAFHRRGYRPTACSLAVAGALDGLDLEAMVAGSALADLSDVSDVAATGAAAAAATPTTAPSAAPAQAQTKTLTLQPGRHTLRLPRLEAARLLMVWQLPAAADLEATAGADLFTTLLAEGRRSRLVQRLREDLRMVESVDLDLNVLEAGSLALLEAVCEPDQAEAVEAEIGRVWQELSDTPPSSSECERAQRLVANGYRFGLEAASPVAGLIGNQSLWGRLEPLQEPLERLRLWTPQRLHDEILPLFAPERACRVLALPA